MSILDGLFFVIDRVLSFNRQYFMAGLICLALTRVIGFLKKRLDIPKRWETISFFFGVFLIVLAFTVGAGTGLGFGQGSGMGVGNGVGMGGGNDVANNAEIRETSLDEELNNAVNANELIIRICGKDVFLGNHPSSQRELEDVLRLTVRDEMRVIVQDDYADNMTYRDVVKLVEGYGIIPIY